MRSYDVATSFVASIARAGSGMQVGSLGRRPQMPLELYEFEACPYCRKVREALSVLDLDAIVHPCPQGGRRFRTAAAERSGKMQFPFLVDPNTGKEMLESDDIVRYLFETYGDGTVPWALALPIITDVSSGLASLARLGAGRSCRAATAPARPLELWSFEASPFCRLVRERLCELELPYLLHNVAKGSPRRDAFVAVSGRMMVPYLADPNTGSGMFESADICAYLDRTYAHA
ncbi:MAG: glutathione S-transferase N-terminal domain-containing protein [Deltaproteobacteria bacterium]|nr:glutathione S-transferase N-terminal domain-containing protein [Deltaproteobacteria bacterium]